MGARGETWPKFRVQADDGVRGGGRGVRLFCVRLPQHFYSSQDRPGRHKNSPSLIYHIYIFIGIISRE
jgi:hypothetical protein